MCRSGSNFLRKRYNFEKHYQKTSEYLIFIFDYDIFTLKNASKSEFTIKSKTKEHIPETLVFSPRSKFDSIIFDRFLERGLFANDKSALISIC